MFLLRVLSWLLGCLEAWLLAGDLDAESLPPSPAAPAAGGGEANAGRRGQALQPRASFLRPAPAAGGAEANACGLHGCPGRARVAEIRTAAIPAARTRAGESSNCCLTAAAVRPRAAAQSLPGGRHRLRECLIMNYRKSASISR